jgi:hypothetical protein
MNGEVYPVNGGMEDFLYGVWEGSPIITYQCVPVTYGGYPPEKTIYTSLKDIIKSIMFLLETSDDKIPSKELLGRENLNCLVNLRHNAFFNQLTDNLNICLDDYVDGYIPRIIRIALTLIDIVLPYVNSKLLHQDDHNVTVQWTVGGAINVDKTYIAYNYYDELPSKEGFEKSIRDARQESEINLLLQFQTDIIKGKALWSDGYSDKDWFKQTIPKNNKKYLVLTPVTTVDELWKSQTKPDPNVPPQSHLSNIRINPNYNVQNNGFELQGRNIFVGDIQYIQMR